MSVGKLVLEHDETSKDQPMLIDWWISWESHNIVLEYQSKASMDYWGADAREQTSIKGVKCLQQSICELSRSSQSTVGCKKHCKDCYEPITYHLTRQWISKRLGFDSNSTSSCGWWKGVEYLPRIWLLLLLQVCPQKRVYVGDQKEHSKKCTMNIKLDWNGKKPAGISYWKKTLKSLRRKTEIFGRCSLFTVQTMVKLSGIKEVFTHWGSKKRRNLMQNLSLTSIYEERGAYDSWCNRAGVRALGVSINLDAISS